MVGCDVDLYSNKYGVGSPLRLDQVIFCIVTRGPSIEAAMTSLLTVAIGSTIPYGIALFSLLVGGLAFYVIYQRYFHPLSSYPGPFWASLTDLWQVFQFLSLKQPYRLTELHEKHGPFVRYGPDKLSITAEEAVAIIYQRGGKNMPKTEFYDAYGAKTPNVFGMRDEHVRLLESPLSPRKG